MMFDEILLLVDVNTMPVTPFFDVNSCVSIPIYLGEQNLYLPVFARWVCATISQCFRKLLKIDKIIVIQIVHSKDFLKFLHVLAFLFFVHLHDHHDQELIEINGTRAILIDLEDDLLQLLWRRALAKKFHYTSEFTSADVTASIFVKDIERLFEFVNLGLVEVFARPLNGVRLTLHGEALWQPCNQYTTSTRNP